MICLGSVRCASSNVHVTWERHDALATDLVQYSRLLTCIEVVGYDKSSV